MASAPALFVCPPSSVPCRLRFRTWMLTWGICGIVLWLFAADASAQDLRVVTKLSSRNQTTDRWQPVARSLTLFHGGKTYDYVETVSEVVIHEPAQNQFVILSLNGNKVATTVPYAELLNYLKVARSETVKYIDELQSHPKPASPRSVQALTFQLDPQFQADFDPSTAKLRLISEFIRYEVETAAVERPRVLEQYLLWADWTARLNYVLHPQAVMPDVRLALNKALRDRERLPTQVSLARTLDDEHLRAEHSFEWKLRSFDRESIATWEKIRTDEDVRWVDLRQYQQILVTAFNRSGR